MQEEYNNDPQNEYDNEKLDNSNNLIQMIWQAIADPKGYRDFFDLSKKRFKRFILIIMFLVTLMVVGLQIIVFIVNDGYTYITIGRSKVNILTQGANGRYFSTFSQSVSSFLPDGLNNSKLVKMTPMIYLGLILSFAIRMGLFFLKYWILSFIYGFYAKGLNLATGNIHNEQEMNRLCLVSQTCGIFLVNLNKAIGTPIPGFIVSIVGIFMTIRRISLYFSNYIGDKGMRPDA